MLVDHREPRRPEKGLPLRLPVAAHVRGIAAPLDLADERVRRGVVVAEDVLQQERAAGAEHTVDLADKGADVREVMGGGSTGDDVESAVAERQGRRVAGDECYVRAAP